MKSVLPPEIAWDRLPAEEWNEATARHLLRRVGWTARTDDVIRAQQDGLERTLDRLFPATPAPFAKTSQIIKFEADLPLLRAKARETEGLERRAAQREMRERSQAALQDLSVKWLQAAAVVEHSASMKWVLFLSNIYVVSAEKVRHSGFIWQHFDILSRYAFGPAPTLTKAVARSPAMAMYLDLERSSKVAPNENFARELFELFVLGEGQYAEQDIKEAARAFTGFRVEPVTGDFRFNPRRHDGGVKTVFGRTGRFSGDDVIDLAYDQPAAGEFLVRELGRFYLSDDPLEAPQVAALASRWRRSRYDLRAIAHDFFGSRIFFSPEYSGNFIKSPAQFYLGLIQDLDLQVPPLARYTSSRLRQMGQQLFQPPNVRGWVGGRTWINSSNLAVRRQLVQQLFQPVREAALNADEVAALQAARAADAAPFSVSEEWLDSFAALPAQDAAQRLLAKFLGVVARPEMQRTLRDFIGVETDLDQRRQRLRTATVALLQTPPYQLC